MSPMPNSLTSLRKKRLLLRKLDSLLPRLPVSRKKRKSLLRPRQLVSLRRRESPMRPQKKGVLLRRRNSLMRLPLLSPLKNPPRRPLLSSPLKKPPRKRKSSPMLHFILPIRQRKKTSRKLR